MHYLNTWCSALEPSKGTSSRCRRCLSLTS